METLHDPIASLRRQWDMEQTSSRVPLRLFHHSRAGRLALLTLPPSDSPAAQESLICYRWRALIDLGDDGLQAIVDAPTRDAALEELSLADVLTRRAARQHLWRQGRRDDLAPAERAFVEAARQVLEP